MNAESMSMTDQTKRCSACGETILAVAKKCKHCQTDLTISESDGKPSKGTLDVGAALLAVPVVGALLAWFWIGNMNLLQSPGSSLTLVVVATICITAILAAVEANSIGSSSNRQKGSYSPLQWFLIVALIWIVGYPAYLFKRRNYGLKNYLWAGLGVMVVFLVSAVIIESTIEARVREIQAQLGIPTDDDSLMSKITGLFRESREDKARKQQEISLVQNNVSAILDAGVTAQTEVAEYYETSGNFPSSCSSSIQCAQGVSVGEDGRVVLNLSTAATPQLAGKSIALIPSVDADSSVHWSCASDADFQYIPTQCHNAIPAVAALTAVTAAAHESASTATVPEPAPVTTANTTTVPVRTDIGADALSPSSVQPADTAASASSGGSTSPAKPAAQVQPSFDCAKAAAVVEKLICSTPGLATADAELATFYKKNIVASGSDAVSIKRSQRAFIEKRNQCGTAACIAEAYRARYEELAQLGYVRE